MPVRLTPRFTLPTASCRTTGPLAIDLSGIVPDRTRSLPADEVARMIIRVDERPSELRSVFHVEGDPSDGRIECSGDFSRVHHVGRDMAFGSIAVAGSVGRHAAAGMTGGVFTVAGDAGDWLAQEMAGGEVHVAGNVGDNAAAARPGSDIGMRGGMVVIGGHAGCLAGVRMRRGILAIAGDCGPAVAFEMRAGTVLVGGGLGSRPALGMRRGSLIGLSPMSGVPPGFKTGASWQPAFLLLLLRRLGQAGFGPALAGLRGAGFNGSRQWRFRQWHGDALAGCRGEIWAAEAS